MMTAVEGGHMSHTRHPLPGRSVPYMVRAVEAPAYLVAGQVVNLLATTAETAGSFHHIPHCADGADWLACADVFLGIM